MHWFAPIGPQFPGDSVRSTDLAFAPLFYGHRRKRAIDMAATALREVAMLVVERQMKGTWKQAFPHAIKGLKAVQ
jgi:hypothetical protein